MLRYCSLFSGSTGNCTYVGTAEGGLLVDVGVSAKRIIRALESRDIDLASIRAVLVSHEHSDHVAGLRVLGKKYGWPVIASEGTLDALTEEDKTAPNQPLYVVQPGQTVTAAGLRITAFSTPHDSRSCLGFRVDSGDGRSLAVATDMGYLPQSVLDAITGCQLIHIESNHDPEMLRTGPYPYYLQQRILGQGGHLSNAVCAGALPGLVAAGATRIALAHLSQHNNTPALAQDTAVGALAAAGVAVGQDCLLWVTQPDSDQPVLYF